jgi:uncharacterized membrane protein
MRNRGWQWIVRAWTWRVEITPTPGLVLVAVWWAGVQWLTPAGARKIQAGLNVVTVVSVVALVAFVVYIRLQRRRARARRRSG